MVEVEFILYLYNASGHPLSLNYTKYTPLLNKYDIKHATKINSRERLRYLVLSSFRRRRSSRGRHMTGATSSGSTYSPPRPRLRTGGSTHAQAAVGPNTLLLETVLKSITYVTS